MQDSEDEYLREMTNKRLWHKKTCVESHIQPKLSGETFLNKTDTQFFWYFRHQPILDWFRQLQRLWMLLLLLL